MAFNQKEEDAISYFKQQVENLRDTSGIIFTMPMLQNEDVIKKDRDNLNIVLDIIEKQEKENMNLKELYVRVAKHQEKIGHTELAEYMLAQIQAIPTFTTWEEYTTWVSKDDLRKILDKYAKKEIDFSPELYKELRQLLEEK
nr:MAG TPA: Proprotein convertase subtilisin/kexin type 9 convertase, subtilisin, HYDROLASE.4A [Caudoviricetes sp.]